MDWERDIRKRYAKAMAIREPSLCGPVAYSAEYTKNLPQLILDKDYGCANPSKFVQLGDAVVDLGCGAGVFSLVASQLVGPKGKVIGIDMTDEALAVARAAAVETSKKTGLRNIEFHKAKVQDLRLDLEKMERRLLQSPVISGADLERFEEMVRNERIKSPMISDSTTDLAVGNNIMNLVDYDFRQTLLLELIRVLNNHGRAIFCELIADKSVPKELQKNPEYWTAGVSGAWTEAQWNHAFQSAGFKRNTIVQRSEIPWIVLEGIAFRPMILLASKGLGRENEIRDTERKI